MNQPTGAGAPCGSLRLSENGLPHRTPAWRGIVVKGVSVIDAVCDNDVFEYCHMVQSSTEIIALVALERPQLMQERQPLEMTHGPFGRLMPAITPASEGSKIHVAIGKHRPCELSEMA